MSLETLIRAIESGNYSNEAGSSLSLSPYWDELKFAIVNLSSKEIVPVHLYNHYQINGKKGVITCYCTKENEKSWIMYEVNGSRTPGSRWTIYKKWCQAENLHQVTSSESIPAHTRIY